MGARAALKLLHWAAIDDAALPLRAVEDRHVDGVAARQAGRPLDLRLRGRHADRGNGNGNGSGSDRERLPQTPHDG